MGKVDDDSVGQSQKEDILRQAKKDIESQLAETSVLRYTIWLQIFNSLKVKPIFYHFAFISLIHPFKFLINV